MIYIELTQEEINAVYLQLIGRLDFFDEEIKEAAKSANTKTIVELSKTKETLNDVVERLCQAGADLNF